MSLVLKIVKTELISQIDKYHLISLKCGIKKKRLLGFPGGSVVESSPASTGDTGSILDLEGPHMPRSRLSPCTTTNEPVL